MGPVDRFRLRRLGQIHTGRVVYSAEFLKLRREPLNDRMVAAFERAHQERPVDWLSAYARCSGDHITGLRHPDHQGALWRSLRQHVPLRQAGLGRGDGGGATQRCPSVSLRPSTSGGPRTASPVDWVNAEGGRAESTCRRAVRPSGLPSDEASNSISPVSFVGACLWAPAPHGPFPARITERRCRSSAAVGRRWCGPRGCGDGRLDIFRRSQINLGYGKRAAL